MSDFENLMEDAREQADSNHMVLSFRNGTVRTSTVGALVSGLLDVIAVRDMQLARVREFVAEPPDHQHVADYYRWTGNAQARQQLAAVLDMPSPNNCFTPDGAS